MACGEARIGVDVLWYDAVRCGGAARRRQSAESASLPNKRSKLA